MKVIRNSIYSTYHAMKQRCYNKKNPAYKYYGGRGISVCKRWLFSYEKFCLDMGKKPSPKHTLERINVNGNYCPKNCKWVLHEDQQRNTTKNIRISIGGETKCLSEWARHFGINRHCVQSRLRKGMDALSAVTTPSDKDRYKPKPIMLRCNGKLKTLSEWSKISGLSKSTIWTRVFKKGMSHDAAILTKRTRPKK